MTLDGELLDVGAPAPKPGTMYVISIMRYAVLRVVRGTYGQAFVHVGHHMPDLSAPAFRIGARHRLELTTEFPTHATLLQPANAGDEKAGVFFCLKFEMLDGAS
jgi:hypothetical protein